MSEDQRSACGPHRLSFDLVAYGLGSTAAFTLDASILWLLTNVGLHYLVSAGLGFAAGLCCIYLISVKVVFRTRRCIAPRAEFLWFAIIGALGLALNELVLFLAVATAHLTIMEAKFVAAFMVFLFNFSMRRLFLFSEAGPGEKHEPIGLSKLIPKF